jgi:hypothetical protein
MNKGLPIPTRFDPPEDQAIKTLHKQTGLSNAEIVRRAVRLLNLRYQEEGSVGFILDDLAPARVGEAEPRYKIRKSRKRGKKAT